MTARKRTAAAAAAVDLEAALRALLEPAGRTELADAARLVRRLRVAYAYVSGDDPCDITAEVSDSVSEDVVREDIQREFAHRWATSRELTRAAARARLPRGAK